MKNIKIKEVSISNIFELFAVIKEALNKCEDTQFFVSNILFERILIKNKNNIIWEETVLNSFHYCDKVENAYIFCIKDNNETKTAQTHFVSNCIDYMHLTFFASKGILYRHYLKGMKIIFIINSD